MLTSAHVTESASAFDEVVADLIDLLDDLCDLTNVLPSCSGDAWG
jgi:hypothetical protein